ncbi:MAG TPA: chromosomal replication initiator protein DnaA [Kiritimatiellia bacterium]|nr:chromosomal replication initiator protein DnaA [Kiritimatiellia bacterium]HMO99576.1 chromosomal replication initiator protein DnaA [Kiritimatiellia bacterium]HMP97549.1 chromosomal replication initiator protein DnaA [Kiritimatiellia bacterium]
MNATAVWSRACKHLKDTLSKDVFDRWIAVIEAKSLQGDELVLRVANNFYQNWLEENYLSLIQDAVTSASEQPLKVSLEVDRSLPSLSHTVAAATAVVTETPAPAAPAPRAIKSSATLNAKYTFEKFIVGPSNSFPHAASMAVAQSPGRAYNPLFLYGGVGLGKTHLMQAIGNHVLQQSKASVCYVTSEALLNEYIDAIQKKGLVQFRKKYRTADVLLIDDIQFLGGKERMQEEFFHTFNALFDNHKQIVLTCDRPASEIPGLEHRLVSRFEWGLVTELELPDVETRIAILRNKQEQLGIKLPDDILNYLAENIRANIRRLEGALIRVVSFSSLTGKPITMESVEYLLRDTLDQEQQQLLTIEEIQKVVSDYYDIRMGDMTSNRRPQAIAFPRQVAMYLSRELTGQSLPAIGQAFAKNHATVLYACKTVNEKVKVDASFRQSLMVLQQRLSRKG